MNVVHVRSDDLLIIGGVLVVMVLLALIAMDSGKGARLRKRIARIRSRKSAKPKSTTQDVGSLRRKTGARLSPLLEALLKPLPNIEAIGNKLQRAGFSMGAKQYFFRCLLGMLVLTGVLIEMNKSPWLSLGVGFLVSFWLPLKVLNRRINKAKKKFLLYFPDGIDLIVRGLRSGLPVSESINLVASEVQEPVAGVFGHIRDIVKLGVPLEKAMQEMARKLDYTEFNFFVTSIVLQRETGGNLSEILDNLADVLRKRIMMQMKIKSMTSEARASSIIVGVLPFFVMGAVSFMSPGYLNVLYVDPRGQKSAIVAAFLLLLGIWTMRRMGKFEI